MEVAKYRSKLSVDALWVGDKTEVWATRREVRKEFDHKGFVSRERSHAAWRLFFSSSKITLLGSSWRPLGVFPCYVCVLWVRARVRRW